MVSMENLTKAIGNCQSKLNLFHNTVLFLYPLKISEYLKFLEGL